ncbi:MAG: hypothetical protein JWO06_1017 [Bacteroidota bacterium]|nr:hypothetical protein [Bacteroidota bacterium]
MKNFFLSVIFIAVAAAIFQMFGHWWVIALVAFAIGYLIELKSYLSFLSGFLGIFLLWTLYAAGISHGNHDLLAKKVSELLPFHGHVYLLIIATGTVGGLVGGFASLTGRLTGNLSTN